MAFRCDSFKRLDELWWQLKGVKFYLSVWPNHIIKSNPFPPPMLPKRGNSISFLKSDFFNVAQTNLYNTFLRKNWTNTYQKWPNLSYLFPKDLNFTQHKDEQLFGSYCQLALDVAVHVVRTINSHLRKRSSLPRGPDVSFH